MIQVRPATRYDAPDIARVHVAAIRGLNAQYYTAEQIAAWSSDKQPERYVQALAEGEFMVVAESPEGVIVGFGSSKADEVRAVYVDPEHARHGIGSKLLEALESEARARGETSLHLDSSLGAVAFYAAHGYVERERVLHRLRGGCQLECVPMTRVLERSS
jgi:GNAT superfamily N-acetyltransferase